MRPKRVGICTTQVPFTTGGAEALVAGLARALGEAGHHAEIIPVPFKWYPPAEIVKNMLVWRWLDLTSANGMAIDAIIGMKFPAYLARHPHKVLWIMHQYRTAYDLWDGEHGDLRRFEDGPRVREMIKRADGRFIREARHVYTISQTVSDRLHRFNRIPSEPLYHPPPRAEALFNRGYGSYVFYPSRLDGLKRQELLVEAMAHVKTDVTCCLAGTGSQEGRLRELVARRRLGDRVRFLGFLSEDEMLAYYADALAVYFGPLDEDYGYVTLEAFCARKAVITLADSGGPLEFVTSGVNGFVVPPEPRAIAAAIDHLAQDRALAEKMGTQAFEMFRDRNITWPNVVRRLLP